MSRVVEVVRRFRGQLAVPESEAGRTMASAWSRLDRILAAEADHLARRMERALANGETIRVSWLHRQGDLERMRRQIADEVDRFARQAAGPAVRAAQEQAAALSTAAATESVTAAGTARLTIGSTIQRQIQESVVASVRPGTPVGNVLASMGKDTANILAAELERGVAIGENPRRVAARMRQVSRSPLARARTVARTEMFRAYREGHHAMWAEYPPGIVTGWQWLSAADSRSCAACLARHGQVFRTDQRMSAHPNCRCTMSPVVEGQRFVSPLGADLLRSMSADRLGALLGRELAGDFRAGRVAPLDLIDSRTSRTWGRTDTQASRAVALRNAARRRAR